MPLRLIDLTPVSSKELPVSTPLGGILNAFAEMTRLHHGVSLTAKLDRYKNASGYTGSNWVPLAQSLVNALPETRQNLRYLVNSKTTNYYIAVSGVTLAVSVTSPTGITVSIYDL